MTILITGGGGFLGNVLARELIRRSRLEFSGAAPETITSIVLLDVRFSEVTRAGFPASVSFVEGDVANLTVLRDLFTRRIDAVFHLAAMVSGDGERDFDGCLRSNLDATRWLLDSCRTSGRIPRVVFASSLAVFGGKVMPDVVSDTTKPLPQTTYGMTKLMGELLINEYSRKGFIDGRAARIPTIFIRPGKPNAAASSFASALFREPINGATCELPVSRDQSVPLLGYRRLVANLIRLMECRGETLGDDRTVTLPSTRYRVDDMIRALERVATAAKITLGPIVDRPDPSVRRIVQGWPVGTDASRARMIGLSSDETVEEVIRDYLTDFGPPRTPPT